MHLLSLLSTHVLSLKFVKRETSRGEWKKERRRRRKTEGEREGGIVIDWFPGRWEKRRKGKINN